jgi:hypothetical protein
LPDTATADIDADPFRELEEEFSLMASMGDVPDIARNVVPLRSCHRLSAITPFLPSKNAL